MSNFPAELTGTWEIDPAHSTVGFAVKREDIVNGAADLGVDLEEHIAFCIDAMKGIAAELGL
jgi:predicted hydrolase (HD superfamily)